MKTSGNTILITGGSAGIGLSLAKLFSEQGNTVIITGRDEKRLLAASGQLKNVIPIVSDVSNHDDVVKVKDRLSAEYPALNVVINNAGRAILHDLSLPDKSFENASDELLTNFLSVVRLNEQFLPLLKKKAEAAIVNVSSIVAFVPNQHLSTYAASKAALHSYTQSLRLALNNTGVKVFELMPPLVNTDFSKEIGGANGIPPEQVASELLEALKSDSFEVRVGRTEDIYRLYLKSPAEALLAMNANS